jgi:hypothetical protein
MAFEYEALVGHLVVVGGRAISHAPPGALVEVAPRKSARGRETDTFFTLVLPSGDGAAPAAFYENMAELAAEKYFETPGSVTSALRAVFSHLNDNLYEHNTTDKRRYEATIICAVLRSAELILARTGAGIALLRHEGALTPFPAPFDDDDALFGPPLGVQPVPDVRLMTTRITTGTRLLLADPALADLDIRQVGASMAASDIAAVMGAIKGQVPVQLTLMAVEFVPPEIAVPVPVRTTESTRDLAPIATAPTPPVSTAAAGELHPPAPPPSTERGDMGEVATVEVPPIPLPPKPRNRGLPLPVQESLANGAMVLGSGANGALKLLDRIAPPDKDGKRGRLPSGGTAITAILIPVAVVVFVFIMWVTGTGESQFDLCVRQAQAAAETARTIPSNDVNGTINAWNAASQIATECQRLRPELPSEALTSLLAEAQIVNDRLMVISRRELAIVASFPQAGLSRGVLQGQDLYVLDNGNDQVYRVTLTDDGLEMQPNSRQALAFMRRTAQVNEYQVGDLVDIAWAEDGSGLSQDNVLVAVDSSGLVIDCAPRFTDTCGTQRLQGVENWLSPVAIQIWSGRLYVLDPGANQLWRYDPPGPNTGALPNAPLEYFSGEGRPDIRTAVDFAIDTEGVVYVLLANGSMLKFRGGERVDFAYAGFPQGQSLGTADAFYLSTSPLRPAIYISSRGNRAIYETLVGGTFVHNYRPTNEPYFESLVDVLVNNDLDLVYALSGNSVFAFQRGEAN